MLCLGRENECLNDGAIYGYSYENLTENSPPLAKFLRRHGEACLRGEDNAFEKMSRKREENMIRFKLDEEAGNIREED